MKISYFASIDVLEKKENWSQSFKIKWVSYLGTLTAKVFYNTIRVTGGIINELDIFVEQAVFLGGRYCN